MIERFGSERLLMRPIALSDAEALHEAYADGDLMRWWSSGPHASIAETRAYLGERVGQPAWQAWAMTLKGDPAAIGTLGAHERRPGVIEIGYLLARRHWGHGLAREGVARLINLAFDGGARRVFADTDPDNAASIALLEALGFRREGLLRAEWETHIGVRDTLLLGLLRDEWAGDVPRSIGQSFVTVPQRARGPGSSAP